MSFKKGIRIRRHFTGPFTSTEPTGGTVNLTQALGRINLLAAGMVVGCLIEFLLLGVIKKLVPEFVTATIRVASPVILVALGLSILNLVLTRLQRVPFKARLAVGVSYVLLMGVIISAAEVSTQWWVDGGRLTGMPWVCIWLLLVPLVVPIRWDRALARGTLLSVLPVAVMYAGVQWFGLPPAPLVAYLDFFLPCLIATVLALIIARMMYHLTRQVREAKQLGSYELEERIGSGGMGEVWRARHRMLVRPAAVKLIRPENLGASVEGQDSLIERFQREAQATATLRSPHTVELYDFGVAEDGTFFYVMELLDGLDLNALVNRFGPLPPGRAVHLLRQMCDSLADAHANGLLHRDIKPANVFVCRVGQQTDYVKILDFGLVKSVIPHQDDLILTAEQTVLGTPAFMAPEAIGGKGLDHRADLYSLGCVGYWLLTGGLVFPSESALAMAVAHAREEPPPPSSRSELSIPETLDRIILDCLAKNPADRPQTSAELAARLVDCQCPESWTEQAAASWWDVHLPHLGAARGVSLRAG
jgi:serine/threonine-protein kinase